MSSESPQLAFNDWLAAAIEALLGRPLNLFRQE
jgi:hypothetical protein